ncbi:protein phosphatase 2C domain-containing protein [Sansalvadorimonas verongulae]|uniref:protein phosphatase 2C domain-containing protein n=1 Tax=Sansalvadorimonas verongulae TaxID=2172824 RepID=UPI0012BBED1A|nr:protein phosphatase 2C domain-containing protein [Sansalvadorimonas verongulae]MTI11828.1 hypothetical protein [Sansalvadorimonas verongulae]
MRVLFSGQVPKDTDFPDSNEDALLVAEDSAKIAVSDGASESFDSQSWAKLVVQAFLESSDVNEAWVTDLCKQYESLFAPASLSWSKAAAYQRGSFATLLGLEFDKDSESINALCVGDSQVVLLSNGHLMDAYPYIESKQFQQRPELLCSNIAYNQFILEPDYQLNHRKSWNLADFDQPALLCMTDALAEWALRMETQGDSKWETLLSISELSELESLVLNERREKRMHIDDVTLISVLLDRGKADDIPNS